MIVFKREFHLIFTPIPTPTTTIPVRDVFYIGNIKFQLLFLLLIATRSQNITNQVIDLILVRYSGQ